MTAGKGSGGSSKSSEPSGSKSDSSGTGSNGNTAEVGDFTNIKNVDDFKSRVPENAVEQPWKEIEGGAKEGVKYKWTDADGIKWNVRAHGPDPNVPAGSNASDGWIYRVEVNGKRWMDGQGNFHKKNMTNPASPFYNEGAANSTHIPFEN